MTPIQFVSKIRSTIIEENVAIYRDIFANTNVEDASDDYWKRALALFNGLDGGGREVFFEILRQVSIDTTSNVLGVIDGVNILDGAEGEFTLEYSGSSEPLSGDLQSLFLAEVESE